LWTALGGVTAMLCGSATISGAQEHAHRGPPGVRIYSANGIDVINTSTYVTPEIELSENAYLFSVAMDLDGQIQVLHPDFPGISVKISAHKQLQLPHFFAGFNQPSFDGVYSSVEFQRYTQSGGWGDTRGVVIALASALRSTSSALNAAAIGTLSPCGASSRIGPRRKQCLPWRVT